MNCDANGEESTLEVIRQELAFLRSEHDALIKNHRKLLLDVLGTNPGATALLQELDIARLQFGPKSLKS